MLKLSLFKKDIPSLRLRLKKNPPQISVLILNWNRFDLLKKTVESLLITSPANTEFFIIDNASTDGSRLWIQEFADKQNRITPILLQENLGGEAFNQVLNRCRGKYILFSENDLEFKPGWYLEMLIPFYVERNLGQLSPFSPFPDEASGEIWGIKPYSVMNYSDFQIFQATGNVGTTCLVPSQLIRHGLRWSNITSKNGITKMPADGPFSSAIKNLGYFVGWSTKAQVINRGHLVEQWSENKQYYLNNWKTKSEFKIDGLDRLAHIQEAMDQLPIKEKENFLMHQMGILCQEVQSLKTKLIFLQRKLTGNPILSQINPLPESSLLYMDTGSGFQSHQLISSQFQTNTASSVCTFELPTNSTIKNLRWDPIEGAFCKIKILNIRFISNTEDVTNIPREKLKFNDAHVNKDGWVEFKTSDPMVFIPYSLHATHLQIEFEILFME